MIGFPHKKWNPGVNIDVHNGVFLTPAGIPDPAVTMGLHMGALVLAMPWLGPGSNNGNDTVLADGMPVVSRGHEVKYLIAPHLNVLPPPPSHINILAPLLILGSSSKCELAACKVRCSSGPLAISGFKYLGLNLACFDPVSMPTSFIVNWGTVNVGFTLGDVLAALVLAALDALKTYIEDKLFSKLMGSKLMEKLAWGVLSAVFKWVLKAGGDKLAVALAKVLAKSLAPTLAKEIVKALLKAFYGETFGGHIGAAAKDGFSDKKVGAWATDPFGVATGKLADGIASWVDGQSESVPSSGAAK